MANKRLGANLQPHLCPAGFHTHNGLQNTHLKTFMQDNNKKINKRFRLIRVVTFTFLRWWAQWRPGPHSSEWNSAIPEINTCTVNTVSKAFQCLQSNKVESFYCKYVDNTQRKILRNMRDSLSFLGEKLCKHRDVIVGWNRILSLERSYFPCPFQGQISEPCSQLLQAIPALGHLLSHNLLWKWLESLNERFTVGCTVFPVPSLRCKWKGGKKAAVQKRWKTWNIKGFQFKGFRICK